jgi:inner membrane transporter RhtA
MALEPAFGVLLGLLVLHQQPSLTQFGGITLVVLAGAAAQRGGRRQPRSRELADTRMDPAVIDPDLIGQGPK